MTTHGHPEPAPMLACDQPQPSEAEYLDILDLEVTSAPPDRIAALLASVDVLPPNLAAALDQRAEEQTGQEWGLFKDGGKETYTTRSTSGRTDVVEGKVWNARFGDFELSIPQAIDAAHPDTRWGKPANGCNAWREGHNPWTRSHAAFKVLVERALENLGDDLDHGGETYLRFCKICGRSACPYGGPYVYIKVRV